MFIDSLMDIQRHLNGISTISQRHITEDLTNLKLHCNVFVMIFPRSCATMSQCHLNYILTIIWSYIFELYQFPNPNCGRPCQPSLNNVFTIPHLDLANICLSMGKELNQTIMFDTISYTHWSNNMQNYYSPSSFTIYEMIYDHYKMVYYHLQIYT